jgi:hypothetical protein
LQADLPAPWSQAYAPWSQAYAPWSQAYAPWSQAYLLHGAGIDFVIDTLIEYHYIILRLSVISTIRVRSGFEITSGLLN